MTTTVDHQSELLVLQLLTEDLRSVSDAEHAERINFNEALLATADGDEPMDVAPDDNTNDASFALMLFAHEAQIAQDLAYAECLQHEDVTTSASRQFAQKLAANERKIAIDADFAAKLQGLIDNGQDHGNANAMDADRLAASRLYSIQSLLIMISVSWEQRQSLIFL